MKHKIHLFIPVLFGAVKYLLRDDFTDTLAAGSVHGTSAAPGPGTRTVVDTGSSLSLTGGNVVNAGIAGGGDPRLIIADVPITRASGVVFVAEMNWPTERGLLGLFDRNNPTLTGHLMVGYGEASGWITEIVSGVMVASNGITQIVQSTSYKFALVLRTTGAYFFVKGGVFTNWTLAWIDSAENTATLYAGYAARAVANDMTSSFLRVPVATWLPTPLAYDSFTRSNGAIGNSETSGPDSQTTPQKTWTGATWTIATNKAKNTPTVSATDLLTGKNGDFAAWTGDDPDGWSVSGESGADPEVAEVATGEDHSDAGTPGGGFCNIYTSDGTLVYIGQNIGMATGTWYRLGINIDTVIAGGLIVGGIAGTPNFSTTGVKAFTDRATAATISLNRNGATDITFDDLSVKAITLSTLFSSLSAGSQDVVADVDLVVTAATQAGLVLCLDSAGTPANFLIAYHDGTNAHLEKCVAGTYTSLIDAAAAYSANATLRVIKDGESVSLFYNGAKIGATQTVSDAGVKDNTIHGLFSTYASNTLDNFTLFPRGNDGEFSQLNKFTR